MLCYMSGKTAPITPRTNFRIDVKSSSYISVIENRTVGQIIVSKAYHPSKSNPKYVRSTNTQIHQQPVSRYVNLTIIPSHVLSGGGVLYFGQDDIGLINHQSVVKIGMGD